MSAPAVKEPETFQTKVLADVYCSCLCQCRIMQMQLGMQDFTGIYNGKKGEADMCLYAHLQERYINIPYSEYSELCIQVHKLIIQCAIWSDTAGWRLPSSTVESATPLGSKPEDPGSAPASAGRLGSNLVCIIRRLLPSLSVLYLFNGNQSWQSMGWFIFYIFSRIVTNDINVFGEFSYLVVTKPYRANQHSYKSTSLHSCVTPHIRIHKDRISAPILVTQYI